MLKKFVSDEVLDVDGIILYFWLRSVGLSLRVRRDESSLQNLSENDDLYCFDQNLYRAPFFFPRSFVINHVWDIFFFFKVQSPLVLTKLILILFFFFFLRVWVMFQDTFNLVVLKITDVRVCSALHAFCSLPHFPG